MSATLNPSDRAREVEKILGYQFSNPAYLHEALHVAGSTFGRDGRDLAILGNYAIALVLSSEGYTRQASRDESTRVINTVASSNNVALVGYQHNLNQFIYPNPSQGRTISNSTMASTVQALLGAAFLDGGRNIDTVQQVMQTLGLSWPATAN
ncbi:hypothetical protein VTO42DRAFT_2979 [Malbranchea cinnamomea]